METKAILLLLCAVLAPAFGARLPYIVGGKAVWDATKYPWQGSLKIATGSHVCGCVLISTTWVLTAAHCVGVSGEYKVGFGSVFWKETDDFAVTKVIKHEKWNEGPGSFPNDIALLSIKALTESNTIKSIPIASGEQAGNTDCHITGWGLMFTGGGGSIPNQLREAHIDVYTQDVCEGWWGDSINDGHVCIGDIMNGRTSCNGDSGGPLVCKVDGSYQLVGVTSWGINGCYTTFPAVYTRLTYFRKWIRDNSGV